MMAQEVMKTVNLPAVTAEDCEGRELKEWLVLPVKTDEMFPTAQVGDVLNVNTREDFKNGDIVIIYDEKNEQVLMRRIYNLEKCVVFTSDNRRYEPIICGTEEELCAYTYFGKVVTIGRYVQK